MLKKLLALAVVSISIVSCASWFTSSQEIPDSPTVGGRQDSSDMLFGQAESTSAATSGRAIASAPMNASAPLIASSPVKAVNASAVK